MGSRRWLVLLVVIALLVGVRCGRDSKTAAPDLVLDDDAVTIGSFDFTESELLAEIYGQALEADGYVVERAPRLGPRELVVPALAGGLVEFVPEYGGSALRFARLGGDVPETEVDATNDALAASLKARDITVLDPAPAQDVNTFVVSRDLAERENLRRISDVARLAPRLAFGGPPECPTRDLCLAGLEEVYGLEFREFVALDAGGPLTRQALENDGVDMALFFNTDPALADPDLVELIDDRDLEPAENVTPLVHSEVIERWGTDFVDSIDAVSDRLTSQTLRELNARVMDLDGDVSAVAAEWLADEGLA